MLVVERFPQIEGIRGRSRPCYGEVQIQKLSARAWFVLLVVAFLMSTGAQAATSTVLLINTEAAEAHATVDFHETDGKLVGSAEKTIAAHGVAVVAIPVSSFNGSARVLADRRVEALVVNTDGKGKVLDSYEAPAPSTMASFPLCRRPGASDKSVAMTVHNINSTEKADVTLRYYDERGVAQGTHTVSLEPLASHNFDRVVASVNKKKGLTATLESSSPVVSAAQLVARGDGISLKAVAQTEECTNCTLGTVKFGSSSGSPYWTEVYIGNQGNSPATVRLTFHTSKGALKVTRTRTIPALGFARFDTRKGGRKRGRDFTGYATVTQSGQAQQLAVQWMVQSQGGKHQMGFNARDSGSGANLWLCIDTPKIEGSKKRRLGRLAITNTAGTTAQASVELYDATSGERLDQKPLQVASKGYTEVSLNAKPYRDVSIGFALVRTDTSTPLIVNAYSRDSQGANGYTCQPLS